MQVSYLKRKQNLSRNKTYTHSFIIFPPLFTAFYCLWTIEMFTNIFLCKPFVTKITPFTACIEVQPDSCSSFQTKLCVWAGLAAPLHLPLCKHCHRGRWQSWRNELTALYAHAAKMESRLFGVEGELNWSRRSFPALLFMTSSTYYWPVNIQ